MYISLINEIFKYNVRENVEWNISRYRNYLKYHSLDFLFNLQKKNTYENIEKLWLIYNYNYKS